MPIHITWGNDDHKLIIVRFVSPWNGNELIDMIDEGVSLLNSVPYTVDVIVDFREAAMQIPTQYLQAVRRINDIGLLNRGPMVIVGAPYFIRTLTKFAQEIAPVAYSNLYFSPNINAAHALLAEKSQNRA